MDFYISVNGAKVDRPQHPDGAYGCFEGDQICITIKGPKIADLEVEGCLIKKKSVSHQGDLFSTVLEYCPATYAGRTRLIAFCGEDKQEIEVDIAPAPDKLGKEAFLQMLDELEARMPGLPWGMSPGYFRGLMQNQSAMITRPRVVEDLLDGLVHALRGLRSSPLLQNRRVREVRRMAYNRRPDITTVRRLAQSPYVAVAWAAMVNSGKTEVPPVNMDQAVTVISHDHPVTRYLVWLLVRLKNDLSALGSYLESAGAGGVEGVEEEGQAYCSELAKKLIPVIEILGESLTKPPLDGVAPAPLGDSAIQALLNHPASLRVHSIARKMMSAGLKVNRDEGILAGLRRTCDLYEFLVLFRMADALALHLGAGWQWDAVSKPGMRLLRDVSSAGLITLSRGEKRVELRMQQLFRSTTQADMSDGFMSLSDKREPDFVIGLTNAGGELLSWMVLDAKFRTKAKHVRNSLEKIHIYRDALRWNGRPPVAGYAVVPKLIGGANLYASDAYRGGHNFGVIHCPLEPDEGWLAPVTAWLDKELSAPETRV